MPSLEIKTRDQGTARLRLAKQLKIIVLHIHPAPEKSFVAAAWFREGAICRAGFRDIYQFWHKIYWKNPVYLLYSISMERYHSLLLAVWREACRHTEIDNC